MELIPRQVGFYFSGSNRRFEFFQQVFCNILTSVEQAGHCRERGKVMTGAIVGAGLLGDEYQTRI